MTATKTPRYYPAEDIKPAKNTYRVKQNVSNNRFNYSLVSVWSINCSAWNESRNKHGRSYHGPFGSCGDLLKVSLWHLTDHFIFLLFSKNKKIKAAENSQVHYTWNSSYSFSGTIPRKTRCLFESTRIRFAFSFWTIQNQWCATPTCEPSICYRDIDKCRCFRRGCVIIQR